MPFTNLSTRVGKYEIGKKLGEGAFSKVKIARNVENGATVAIKVMDKERLHKCKQVEKTKREIASMKLVNHPYVVQLLEVMASTTKIYLVLEYVPGGDLLHKIKAQKQLKEDQARKYFQQLIDGVDYLHSRNIYHRDLKPNNLLIDAHGDLKIADFGLSALCQQFGSDGLLHTMCGTPSFIAPEMIRNRGYDGAAADLWSCGVILFMLMAGYVPFRHANTVALFKKILQAEFTCPPWFSLGATRLIRRMLDPDPRTRITTAHIRKDEWFSKGYTPVNVNIIDAVVGEANAHTVTNGRDAKPVAMDAIFEINSLSRGLDLSGLFERKDKKASSEEIKFTSEKPSKEIIMSIDSKLLSHWILV